MELTIQQLDAKSQNLNQQLLLCNGTIKQTEARLADLDVQAHRIEGALMQIQELKNDVQQMNDAVAKKEAEDRAKEVAVDSMIDAVPEE